MVEFVGEAFKSPVNIIAGVPLVNSNDFATRSMASSNCVTSRNLYLSPTRVLEAYEK